MEVWGDGTAVVSYLGYDLSCLYALSFFNVNFSYVYVVYHYTVFVLKINLAVLGVGV